MSMNMSYVNPVQSPQDICKSGIYIHNVYNKYTFYAGWENDQQLAKLTAAF